MTASLDDTDLEPTVPPARMLRFDRPIDLYRSIPEVAGFTRQRPSEDVDAKAYFEILRRSTTPEDAITFTAFVMQPAVSIRWGLESLHATIPEFSPEDQQILSWVQQWLDYPSNDNRWRAMQVAMFSPRRTAAVYLGLAVGWSGGALAPNDPVELPPWRTPKAVNAAILRTFGQTALDQRSIAMARILDLASRLFRVY